MKKRKNLSVLIVVLLLAFVLSFCLSACEDPQTPSGDGLDLQEAVRITVNLHDTLGPRSETVVSLLVTEADAWTKTMFIANHYDCIGVYDQHGTLLYDFDDGWSVNVFDEGYLARSANENKEIDLWLRWEPQAIRLDFNRSGIEAVETVYGASLSSLPVPELKDSDYTFVGWLSDGKAVTDKDGKVLIPAFDEEHCSFNGRVVSLQANLMKKQATVIFMMPDSVEKITKTFDYGHELLPSECPNVAESDHREFVGWSTDLLQYTPLTGPLRSPQISLYPIRKKYSTVSFYDGEEMICSVRVYEGSSLDLRTASSLEALGLGKEDHEIEGVYDTPQFSGDAEKVARYLDGADTVLYVRWERVYAVTYYEGEHNPIGTAKVRNGDKLRSHYYSLIEGTANASHQLFGLYLSPTFEGDPVTDFSADNVITALYAKRADANGIRYMSNYPQQSGKASLVKTSYAFDGSESAWVSEQFSCPGWAFAGWATAPNGKIVYANGTPIDEACPLQEGQYFLYAFWKVIPTEVGAYVPTKTVVSDTDGENAYTVYNTIDSTPWNLADYAIVDWRSESNTNVASHTARIVNDKRYENIDICTNTRQVYFVGSKDKIYTNFMFHLVNFTSNNWLNVVFVNFRYETSHNGALKTWWGSDHKDKNANLRLTLIGDNAIGSSCASGDLIYQMTHMIVDGSGTLVLRAGKGTDAWDAGTKGGDGGVAIRATLLEVALDATGKLTVYGGAGGAGAAGEDSNAQGASGWTRSWPWQEGAGDGEQGGQGGIGGVGGDGGDAMIGALFVQTGNCIIVGGNGGNGGKGGRGGKGGKGGNNTAWGGSTGNGGKGGKGGTGGNNGIGSHNVRLSFKCSDTAFLNVLPGSNGEVGAGGSGGYGGDPGSPNALCGGGGGYGATGDKGDPGVELNVYDYDGHHYLLVYDSLDWDEAKAYCESLGGHLATITSAEEQAFLETFVNVKCWLGATDRETEGTWKWVTGEAWNYTHWRSGEPNNDNDEDYLGTFSQEWNDYKKTSSGIVGFVCEWEPTSLNGHYYKRFDAEMTWDEAKAYCESLGGHLATITSAEEDSFVRMMATSAGSWIGGTDAEAEGVWKWVTGEAWAYANWGNGEPNDYGDGEDVAELNGSYWNDNNGGTAKSFICEWDHDPDR